MKKLLLIFAIGMLFNLTTQAKPANPPAGFGIFFSVLNPHGTWIELDYGMIVWRPTVMARHWAPYRQGNWVWTVDGWYWDSYEPFGHVTYHYGRWFYDDYYGWLWVPDYEWAPAWVEWRYDDAYIGWAPLHPYAAFTINVGIHFTYDYYTPYAHWHFVDYHHFCEPYVYNHFVGPKYKYRVYQKTKYRTNYDYYDGRVVNRGVDIDYVRKRSGNEIRTRELERVRDYAQLDNRGRNDNKERVRTLYIPKDDLERTRDNYDRDKIKRTDRKTNLDITRVTLGDRRQIKNERNNDRITRENTEKNKVNDRKNERDVIKRERNEGNENRNPIYEERTNEIKKEETRNNDRNERKEVTRNNERNERKDVQVNTRNNRTVEEEKKKMIENTRQIQNEIKKDNEERKNRTETGLNTKREEKKREEVKNETRTERKNERNGGQERKR